MKHFLLLVSLAIGNFYPVNGQPAKPGDTIKPSLPKIYFIYFANGTPFDRSVFRLTNKPADEDLIREAGRRVNEFQTLWDKDGPTYLNTVFSEFGLSFPYTEMQATLTVSGVPSTSAPLLINVKQFLSSAQNPAPTSAFPEIVFHELLHVYLRRLNDSSALRKKYIKETFVVRNHLHLMALEKYVLLKLGRDDLLKWMDTDYRTGDLQADYKRAWEIVNDKEGYEAFIKELKLAGKE
jgi:hypothetical protein